MTGGTEGGGGAAARRFAWRWLRVELACVLSKSFVRPATAMLVASTAVLIAVLSPVMRLWVGPSVAQVLAFLAGTALATALYSLTAFWVEARSFAAAPCRWLLTAGDGWAGAYARPDRHGRLTLYSVWASPRRQQLGSRLMRQICAEMDAWGCELHLVAVNGDAVRFYRHFGFQQARRGWFVKRMVRPYNPSQAVE